MEGEEQDKVQGKDCLTHPCGGLGGGGIQALGYWVLGVCRGGAQQLLFSVSRALSYKSLQATLLRGSESPASESYGELVLLCFVSFLLPGLLSFSAPAHAPVSQHA